MARNIDKRTAGSPYWMWFTVLRVVLGITIIWKALNFIWNISQLEVMIQQTGMDLLSNRSHFIAATVSIISLVCGVFITIGFFARVSSIVMIPIVFVAIVFIQTKNIDRNLFELITTIIVLILLIVVAIKGSGLITAEEYFFKRSPNEKST